MITLLTRKKNPNAVLDWLALTALFLLLVAMAGAGLAQPAKATLIRRFVERPDYTLEPAITGAYVSSYPASTSWNQNFGSLVAKNP